MNQNNPLLPCTDHVSVPNHESQDDETVPTVARKLEWWAFVGQWPRSGRCGNSAFSPLRIGASRMPAATRATNQEGLQTVLLDSFGCGNLGVLASWPARDRWHLVGSVLERSGRCPKSSVSPLRCPWRAEDFGIYLVEPYSCNLGSLGCCGWCACLSRSSL